MKRREFITLLGGTAGTWPLAALAQQPAGWVYRMGCLTIATREQQLHLFKALEEGLRSLGYRVGENVVIEYRFADGELDRPPALASDLVRLGVEVIVTGSAPNTIAAMKATKTIPIVMTSSSDPIGTGRESRPSTPRRCGSHAAVLPADGGRHASVGNVRILNGLGSCPAPPPSPRWSPLN